MHEYEVVDIQSVDLKDPSLSIRKGAFEKPDAIITCDILVVGGGTGGVAAALAASTADADGKTIDVCLTEETDWLGGQMTAQGVSALDENYLVETSGATRSYQEFRTAIRDFYKANHDATPLAVAERYLNPGTCWVTRLSFEPRPAVYLLEGLLQPALERGNLQVYRRTKAIYARLANGAWRFAHKAKEAEGGQCLITAVGMLDLDSGRILEFQPAMILDATELGDMLPLSGLAYHAGSDSRSLTGEKHAPERGDEENVQDYTYPFVLEYRPGENHKIDKPPHYPQFQAAGKFSFQGYRMFEHGSKTSEEGKTQELLPFWTYRRLIDKEKFSDYPFDLSMINWDSNDMRGKNIVDKAAHVTATNLALAKALSLGFLYWLQNEAPRDEGGFGYPELKLVESTLGTIDGLSKFPYIRECRRIEAKRMIVEEDIVAATNSGARAATHHDSVGIGLYPVDIHGRQEVPGAAQETRPFQIPLSALIPRQESNVLPACKNIGTSHITNGAYRLHPIEWSIGEAQAILARFCLQSKASPAQVLEDARALQSLQGKLVIAGIPIFWFDDVPTDHPHFAAIQYAAATGSIPIDADTLHFHPERLLETPGEQPQTRLTRAQFAASVFRDALTGNNLAWSGQVPSAE
jgi:hypothetical protein